MTESTASAASLALPKTIAFIGGGNMAQALLGGLLASGADPTALRVSDPSPACREALAALGPLALFDDNAAAADGAEAVVLAVKPQVLGPILTALAPVLGAQPAMPFVLSIAAGIDCESLLHWSGGVPVVRAMPNTPAHALPICPVAQVHRFIIICWALGMIPSGAGSASSCCMPARSGLEVHLPCPRTDGSLWK